MNGSTHAEQNYTSIVACNSDIMLGSILENIESLYERQQKYIKENDYVTEYIVKSHRYRPKVDRKLDYEKEFARQIPSQHPHEECFTKRLKSSEHLQMIFNQYIHIHNIWPASEEYNYNNDEHVTIEVGYRYSCWRRAD